jgi:hypothetical protein
MHRSLLKSSHDPFEFLYRHKCLVDGDARLLSLYSDDEQFGVVKAVNETDIDLQPKISSFGHIFMQLLPSFDAKLADSSGGALPRANACVAVSLNPCSPSTSVAADTANWRNAVNDYPIFTDDVFPFLREMFACHSRFSCDFPCRACLVCDRSFVSNVCMFACHRTLIVTVNSHARFAIVAVLRNQRTNDVLTVDDSLANPFTALHVNALHCTSRGALLFFINAHMMFSLSIILTL